MGTRYPSNSAYSNLEKVSNGAHPLAAAVSQLGEIELPLKRGGKEGN